MKWWVKGFGWVNARARERKGKGTLEIACSHIPKGGLVGGEYRNILWNCAAGGRLVEWNVTSGGATGIAEI
jgi:hypothetical protein